MSCIYLVSLHFRCKFGQNKFSSSNGRAAQRHTDIFLNHFLGLEDAKWYRQELKIDYVYNKCTFSILCGKIANTGFGARVACISLFRLSCSCSWRPPCQFLSTAGRARRAGKTKTAGDQWRLGKTIETGTTRKTWKTRRAGETRWAWKIKTGTPFRTAQFRLKPTTG